MYQKVDIYLEEGCGRCSLYRTPKCKVHNWNIELVLLRNLALDCGLTEEYKWSQPCYTYKNKNILLVSAFKEYATIAFFKGVLLKDPFQILVAPGENSQSSRQLRFINAKTISKKEDIIKSYIFEAIEIEKSGLNVSFKKEAEPIPEELEKMLDEDHTFKEAFMGLTPGRQRGYILFFSAAKQSKTRFSRIEKYKSHILRGKGIQDR